MAVSIADLLDGPDKPPQERPDTLKAMAALEAFNFWMRSFTHGGN